MDDLDGPVGIIRNDGNRVSGAHQEELRAFLVQVECDCFIDVDKLGKGITQGKFTISTSKVICRSADHFRC